MTEEKFTEEYIKNFLENYTLDQDSDAFSSFSAEFKQEILETDYELTSQPGFWGYHSQRFSRQSYCGKLDWIRDLDLGKRADISYNLTCSFVDVADLYVFLWVLFNHVELDEDYSSYNTTKNTVNFYYLDWRELIVLSYIVEQLHDVMVPNYKANCTVTIDFGTTIY
jgi:hypothetical protein